MRLNQAPWIVGSLRCGRGPAELVLEGCLDSMDTLHVFIVLLGVVEAADAPSHLHSIDAEGRALLPF